MNGEIILLSVGGWIELDGTVHNPLSSENALVKHLSLQQEGIERSMPAPLPIDSLVTSGSPRLDGEDEEHVRTLAESGVVLPPIVVHMPSRRVIDGMHRLRAAIMRGEKDIKARFFYGTEIDVFLLSVAANIQHGLPLSQKDRIAAAERIFVSHPEWSDRMVAVVVGLSNNKVASLRREGAGHIPQPAVRIGRDGRSRPVDGSVGRKRAAKLILNDPEASLRQIARAAGISPSTAADVRDRIRRGEDPIPSRGATKTKAPLQGKRLEVYGDLPREPAAKVISHLITIFDRLRRDPSLRFTEAGRALLHMFDACQAVVRQEDAIKKGLPPHRLALMADLSHGYAELLQSFAVELRELESSQAAEGHESVG